MDIEEQIINLWNSDLSAREIGLKIGKSKGSVIGHVFRLRKRGIYLKERAPAVPQEKRKGNGRRRAKTKAIAEKYKELLAQKKRPSVFEISRTIEDLFSKSIQEKTQATSAGKTLFDLSHRDCRYITGRSADAHLYCAEPSYRRQMCREHYALCYVRIKVSTEKKVSVMKLF